MGRPRKKLPELLGVHDVAIWLRTSDAAIRQRNHRGQLPPPFRHPQIRRLLWRRDDLLSWLGIEESRTEESPQ